MRFDGAKLKQLRETRCWDQHTLAEHARQHGASLNQSTVSRSENGKEPSGRNVVALAAALGIEPRELYDSDDDAEAASMAAGSPLTPAELELLGDLMVRLIRKVAA